MRVCVYTCMFFFMFENTEYVNLIHLKFSLNLFYRKSSARFRDVKGLKSQSLASGRYLEKTKGTNRETKE